MRRKGIIALAVLGAMVMSTVAWGFDAYFANADGSKLTTIQEGQKFWVAIEAKYGECATPEFTADIVIFDFKTGAFIQIKDARFREDRGLGDGGIFFWVDENDNKIWVEVGDRKSWQNVNEMEHELGTSLIGDIWHDGNWMYVDEDVADPDGDGIYDVDRLPQHRETARIQFVDYPGRVENMDTLVLIAAATHNQQLIDQDQVKIVDTPATIEVTPGILEYGCGVLCNIHVQIVDEDENLNPAEIDYVPFFVIVNPGGFTPDTCGVPTPPPPPGGESTVQTAQEVECFDPVNTFCAFKMFGGVNEYGDPINEPIRWYNIYDAPRYIDYPDEWLDGGVVAPAVFFARETGPDTGVFVYEFGILEELQEALGFNRFEAGTTIAFYYLDPNDFDDFTLTTAKVLQEATAEVFFADSMGNPVDEVKLGVHTGLYVRVYDGDANVDACCQDKVVVHLCDPHNEDDSEYWVLDEVANDAGIFASMAAMPLEPVWDAVGGYQLVFDDWKFQAFNEDTIYVRYNSLNYTQESLNYLGDGDANDGYFPPTIIPDVDYWEVAFDTVKVYDTQVFDGATHHMRFLDGRYQPVDSIPRAGNLYLEVTDPDQNENPLIAELIRGNWNLDAEAADNDEDTDPIWWFATGDSDIITPEGALDDVFLGMLDGDEDGNVDESITGVLETAKIFMWNAQRGTWELMDLKETAPNSGVFRSTTCVLVSDERHPGDGNLGSRRGDTIMAFYQDPSNHSDVAIISIKVVPGEVTPPEERVVKVEFDKTSYIGGETVTITVTDDYFAGQPQISGDEILVLALNGDVLETWNVIPAVPGGPDNDFAVEYVLPEDLSGTLRVTYTQPLPGGRSVTDTATVSPGALENVTGIDVSPNPFSNTVTFAIIAEPTGAVADKLTVSVYDLLGRKVAEVSGTDTASVSWDGDDLRNGAYIYVAVVEGADKVWTFRGFVYIKR